VGVVWHLENCGKILPQPTAESAAACRGDGADPSQRGLGTLFGTKIPDPPHLPRNNQGHFQAITDISPFFQVEKLGMLRDSGSDIVSSWKWSRIFGLLGINHNLPAPFSLAHLGPSTWPDPKGHRLRSQTFLELKPDSVLS
jgi:hypothetical protein